MRLFDRSPDTMHSHPIKHLPTVVINALWCLLIALALLAFPLVARQARLQSSLPAHRASMSSPESKPAPAGSKILINKTDIILARH